MSVDSAVMDAPVASDPVESVNLPDAAKDVIREVQSDDISPSAAEEAPKPAEPQPTVDLDAKPAPVEQTPVRLSAEQQAWVKEFGLSEEEVKDLAPEKIDQIRSWVKRRDDKLIRQYQTQQRQRDEQGRFTTAPKTEAPPVRPALSDEYDEDLRKVISHRDSEFDELRAQVKEFNDFRTTQSRQMEVQQIQQANAWFDDQFSKLSEDFSAVFGKGTLNDFSDESTEFAARDKVAEVFYRIRESFPNAKPEELFQKAVATNHLEIFTKQNRADLTKQVQTQSARRLGAGSSTRQSVAEPPGDYDYLRAPFEKMLSENGSR